MIYNTKQELSFGNSDISIGAMGDSFYEYLLKVWLQGGKREMKYRRMYDKSINGILDKLVSALDVVVNNSATSSLIICIQLCQYPRYI